MLDYPGPGSLSVRVVHSGVPLEVGPVKDLGLKADGAVLKVSDGVAEVGIDRTGVDDCIREAVVCLFFFQVVGIEPYLNPLKHPFNHPGVAADRDSLVERVEVVVVKGEAHRKALDDERRELCALPAPLLLGIALYKLLVDVGADKAYRLLLEVFGIRDSGRLPLLLYLCRRLLGRDDSPHFIEGVHVEGERVELSAVVRDRGVGEAVEYGKLIHEVPHSPVVRVEDVGAVLVDMDMLNILCVDISGDIGTPVNNKY